MSRGSTTGLAVRQRLGAALPAMFLDDEFVQRFCDGLDEVLAPVPSALDNFAAILDPALTPPDFLDWLGSWVGVEVDRTWTVQRHRAMVAQAAVMYRHRGTPRGLADLVELFIGVRPDVIEGGAVASSQTPAAELPGADTTLVVRLPMPAPDAAVELRLDALIGANKPGHLHHRIEFVPPLGALPPPPVAPLPAPRPPVSVEEQP